MRSGRAWPVRAGQLFRIVAVEGPQVADFNAWNLATRASGSGRRAPSSSTARTSPLRPAVVVPAVPPADADDHQRHVRYGRDEDGGGCHDLLGTRCDPYVHKLLNGEEFDLCCHSNLVRAVAPYRLTELDVHDVLNVFQVTGLTPEGRYFVKPSPARKGDFVEFFAEIDVLAAISTCPHGDLSVQMWGPTPAIRSRRAGPLGVEIWQPDPSCSRAGRRRAPSDYRGGHGLRSGS